MKEAKAGLGSNESVAHLGLSGEERRLFEALYEYSPLAVSIHHGRELRCVFANKKMRDLFDGESALGHSAERILGSSDSLESENQLLLQLMTDVFRTGEPIQGRSLRVSPSHSGKQRTFMSRTDILPALATDGTRIGVLLSFLEEPARDVPDLGFPDHDFQSDVMSETLEAAGMGSFDWDVVKNTMRGSRRFFEVQGIDRASKPKDYEWTPEDFSASTHPDDVEKVLNALKGSRASGYKEFQIDWRKLFPAGQIRWLAARGKSITDRTGQPVRIVGVCWDRTREKLMELELNAVAAKLRAFHEHAPVGLVEVDLNSKRYLTVNRAFCAMLQFSESELVGKSFVDITHPDDQKRDLASFNEMVSGRKEIHSVEKRYRRRDGKYLWVQVVASAIRDENGIAIRTVGIIQDISERKKIEEALRESQERYQLATALTGIGVFEIDLKTKQVFSTDFLQERFHVPDGVLAFDQVVELIHPEDRYPGDQFAYWKSFGRDETIENESRFRQPDGSYRWKSARAKVVFNEDGEPVRVLGVWMDTTRQKQLVDDLQKAKEQAERANQAKSEFIANMSHEIRTPMNAILGYADLLRDEKIQLNEIESYIERIRKNGAQLLRVIDDVLDFSRLEAGSFSVERTPVDVHALVTETVESLQALAKTKHLNLTHEPGSALPKTIETDPFRLKQILTNVIGNAIKFTAQGSVRIRTFYQGEESTRHWLVIDVEDSGIGVAPDKRARLFNAFTQGDSSVTRIYGGTGLGLLLARRFANALGGDIKLVWSEPGKGSLFQITIDCGHVESKSLVEREQVPVDEGARAAAVQKSPVASTGLLNGVRVLLAEDSTENEALIRIYLKNQGLTLDVAHDGREALEKARTGQHDIVLMDIQMPHLDGLEATRQLLRQGFKTPIVALTAHAMPNEITRSLEAGCVAHLTKPIQKAHLIAEIRRIVDLVRSK